MLRSLVLAPLLLMGVGGCPSTNRPLDAVFVFSTDESETHAQVDAYRAQQDLPPLEADELLGELARLHSEDMLAGRVPFSHDGFDERAGTMAEAGFLASGENVAVNAGFSDPVTTAVEGWLDSPGHHDNIVGDWTHTGVGIATDGDQYYFTQLFGHRDD